MGRIVLRTQFLDARIGAAASLRELEHLLGGLNPLLSLKNAKKVQRADFDDPLPVAHNDPSQHSRFVAEQKPALRPLQSVGFLDHFDRGALAQIRFAERRGGEAREIVEFISLGRRNLDMRPMRLDPIDDVLSAEARRIAGGFMQHGIGNDDIGVDESR